MKNSIDKSTFVVPPPSTGEWRNARVYQNIVGITSEDLISGSNYIEKLKYAPWDSRNELENKNNNNSKPRDEKIGYGKHGSKTYQELKNDEPRYFLWMTENVPRFRLKAAQLGLID